VRLEFDLLFTHSSECVTVTFCQWEDLNVRKRFVVNYRMYFVIFIAGHCIARAIKCRKMKSAEHVEFIGERGS
jgi:hypothetical protein